MLLKLWSIHWLNGLLSPVVNRWSGLKGSAIARVTGKSSDLYANGVGNLSGVDVTQLLQEQAG